MKTQTLFYPVIIFLLITGLNHQTILAQEYNPSGHWEGEIEIPGQPLEILVDFEEKEDRLTGTISIPVQNVKNQKLDKIEFNNDSVQFRIPDIAGNPTFYGTFADKNTLAGDFKQSGQTFSFKLLRTGDPVVRAQKALEGFDTLATKGLEDWMVPGMGIAVVYKGELVLSKGYGKRDQKNDLPVTQNTLFAIGSSTKAFTTFTMATLANEGKLEWEEPVKNYLPEFRMHEPYVTRNITPVDLVTHRSGLPRHDLIWYGNQDASRKELVHSLRHLPLSADLRQKFQYNNLMYLTAGFLTEQLTGQSWENAVRESVLEPLEMERTNFSVTTSQKDDDFAKGYKEEDDKIKPIPFRSINVMGPAGSINSSVEEMSHWMKMQLNQGTYKGKSLVSPSLIEMMHQPHMVTGGSSQHKEISDASYGLGWFIDTYRGHKRVYHGGNIDGFSALVTLFPNDDLGIVILTNKNGTGLPSVMVKHLADRILELESIDWYNQALQNLKRGKAMSKEAKKKKEATRIKGTTHSHELKSYTGTYKHPGYGELTLNETDGKLHFTYHDIKTPLEHWHYDVFNGLKGKDPVFKDMKLQFNSNLDGYIAEVKIPMEPSVDPIVFEKKPDERLYDETYLKRFTGKYTMAGDTLQVSLAGNQLKLKVPGQPQYTLVPALGFQFKLKEYSIVSISFNMNEQGYPTELISDQPGGRYEAKRVEE
jgi:CubicO group peptidase (beta-lactamase class C family)